MKSNLKVLRNVVVTALIVVVIGLTSCEKYIWAPPTFEPPDTTGGFDTIYYSTQLAPLFPQYGCTGCHPGLTLPDLSPANSYQSLMSGGHIDKQNPPQSHVVVNMGSSSHGATVSADDIKLFIDWIYQGAMDN